MAQLTTNAGQFFYTEQGHGPLTVVALHGAGGNHLHWGYQCQALRQVARFILLDLPGHGRSPGTGCTSIASYSAVLLTFLDALGCDRVVLAGHSMGGALALWTALTAPKRVQALMLVATGSRLPVLPLLFTHLEQGQADLAVQLIVERAYSAHSPPQLREQGRKAFLQTDPAVFAADLRACNAYDARDQLANIHCPTLIIGGDDDGITPPKFSRTLYQGIAGASIRMIPQAGHMLMLEQPVQVNETMSAWLKQLSI
ncbi:MAG: alpha/beta hydrolase [Chloroflexaceae bacterium]|nr:alpha/beta hydrolase [Chloroflexaceae bacterium]